MQTIDFDLTELANVLDFPGFSHLLRGAIADSVGAMMVLPERYIVKMSPDTDISLLRFPLPKVSMKAHVEMCFELSRSVLVYGEMCVANFIDFRGCAGDLICFQ